MAVNPERLNAGAPERPNVEGPFPVNVTPKAVAQVKRIQAKEGKGEHFLRIGVKGGGCSGVEYGVRLDARHTPFDQEIELDGLKIVVDTKSALYLKGSTLDFTGDLIGGGFKFENPNAERGCGCGTSFTPKDIA